MTEANLESLTDIKVGNRVRRTGVSGPLGTVRHIRIETVRTSLKQDGTEPPGICITVLWDNGTLSDFVPEGLELV